MHTFRDAVCDLEWLARCLPAYQSGQVETGGHTVVVSMLPGFSEVIQKSACIV